MSLVRLKGLFLQEPNSYLTPQCLSVSIALQDYSVRMLQALHVNVVALRFGKQRW